MYNIVHTLYNTSMLPKQGGSQVFLWRPMTQSLLLKKKVPSQRVLNDLERTKFFMRGNLESASPHPPPYPPLLSASCLSFSVLLCVVGRLIGCGIQPQESLTLYIIQYSLVHSDTCHHFFATGYAKTSPMKNCSVKYLTNFCVMWIRICLCKIIFFLCVIVVYL
jgi:hypothetical protein